VFATAPPAMARVGRSTRPIDRPARALRPRCSARRGGCRESCRVIRQHFLVADAERLDPSLLAERERDEEPELDELWDGEVLVELRP
jgi:hypothetical protein